MTTYDAFAEAFDSHARVSAYNAHYDRPSLLELLGPVAGLRILDAGCGSGLYAAELTARGASVVGIDASTELIRIARARNEAGEFRVHDLSEPLSWAGSGEFDRIVMALVLHHLPHPPVTLGELHRVLADGGHLLASTVHPTSDWLRLGGSYFSDEMVSETWHDDWDVTYRRAPLSAVLDDFFAAGFVVDALVEPRPAPSMQAEYPEVHDKLEREPAFIAFRFTKR